MVKKTWILLIASITALGGLILSMGFISNADDPLKALADNLQKFTTEYPQEKIHIHTDRPYYSAGDTIWFKAYIVNSEINALSNVSKVLYVELINEDDSVTQSVRLPVKSGLAWGDFQLTDTLREGNYRLRAYTSWMRNFGREFYFDKVIPIGNPLEGNAIGTISYKFLQRKNQENVMAEISYTDLQGKPVLGKVVSYTVEADTKVLSRGRGLTDVMGRLAINFSSKDPLDSVPATINTLLHLDEEKRLAKVFRVKPVSAESELKFFPEGGNLVSGLYSKVAFKATGIDGLGRMVSGTVKDKNNRIIAQIKSEHAGMGFFGLTPEVGNIYTAAVRFDDGSEREVRLPEALTSGYVLTVSDNDPENLRVRIATSSDLVAKGPVTLLAQSNGVIKLLAGASAEAQAFTAVIPKRRFRTGLVQFSLLSPSYEPVAERLVFIAQKDELKVKVGTDKALYAEREKVNLSINVLDNDMKPVSGSFSVSVINERKVPHDEINETTIFSNLLLTSDLKGHIEQPNYYFKDKAPERLRHLDNLLLTQGWRRFVLKPLISGKFPTISFFPEKGISISGKIKSLGGNRAVSGGKVSLLARGGQPIMLDTLSDAQGRFVFNNLFFVDSTRMIIQAYNASGKKNVEVEIDRVAPEAARGNKTLFDARTNSKLSLLSYLGARHDEIEELKKYGLFRRSINLREVQVAAKKSIVKTTSSNFNGPGKANTVLLSEKLRDCVDIFHCITQWVPHVTVSNNEVFSTRNPNSPMKLVVDGVYLEASELQRYNVEDIESIEVLRTAEYTAIYGANGSNGLLIITTRRGEVRPVSSSPNIASLTPKGYYLAREFYSPDYSTATANKSLPDLRSTIYWSPNIMTDRAGKASLGFYTAGEPGTYKVVIEGLDSRGGLAREVFRFEVK
jgi:TonB-dependent SusC/RagA subfamily outer membrane receptor